MTAHHGPHSDLHSEQGALRGEHPGRAANPTIKVKDLAWLEFQRPDLAGSERFARAFGFTTVCRTADELQLRGTGSGAPRTESVNTKIRLITRVAFGFTSAEEGTISWVRVRGRQLVRAHRSARRLRSPVQIVAPAVR